MDLAKEYWNYVFVPFLESYRSGYETPNPDVFCNRFVKFLHFKELVSKKFQTEYLATGHYARLQQPVVNQQQQRVDDSLSPIPVVSKKLDNNEEAILLRGIDNTKDQSYFLCMVPVSCVCCCIVLVRYCRHTPYCTVIAVLHNELTDLWVGSSRYSAPVSRTCYSP